MLARRVMDLMEGLSTEDVQRLRPAERYRFGAMCRHFGDVADQTARQADGHSAIKPGVLTDLQRGHRSE
jgi:hypothetical protein